MKGVILAGGTGSRLYPLTKIINKHLLPVGNVPMICHGIEKFRDAGIEEILIVIGKHSAGLFTELLGSGKEWGVRITYKIQEEAGGIAQALSLAEPIMKTGERFVVLLGDNLFEDSLTPYVQAFHRQTEGARVLLKKVHDPTRYGVPILKDDRIESIEEKPAQPKSDYCVTGIYMYDSGVFDVIRAIKPSTRGELEITDVNNVYSAKGQLAYDILDGWWTDAGTFHSLYQACGRVLNEE
ncbi:sugar phosphate nucleotidyltransferase [Paenibacillus spongiae]|uniref:Glucose-1-phosphate thymidylyltransferase n=1 Tax=Paenibacillus spongiae TaxID=2909671 RepID=A0ABY5S3Z6_9BACL|nr:sugar phosphate nucleotidyltransferase [Paenibacillus spongiae]UVI28616.1 NTP transferase domain-containing protein [Paenibacillus spongiae]